MKFKPIKEIKKASVLLSNDDGINSIGIKILEEELQKTGADITVVAPLGERSGAGHAVTSELTELEHYDSWMRLPRKSNVLTSAIMPLTERRQTVSTSLSL